MKNDVKYVVTKDDEMIIFGATISHDEFIGFKPIRAGFINFSSNEDGNPTCQCYGSSFSLRMESDPEKDTFLAQMILGIGDFY